MKCSSAHSGPPSWLLVGVLCPPPMFLVGQASFFAVGGQLGAYGQNSLAEIWPDALGPVQPKACRDSCTGFSSNISTFLALATACTAVRALGCWSKSQADFRLAQDCRHMARKPVGLKRPCLYRSAGGKQTCTEKQMLN